VFSAPGGVVRLVCDIMAEGRSAERHTTLSIGIGLPCLQPRGARIRLSRSLKLSAIEGGQETPLFVATSASRLHIKS